MDVIPIPILRKGKLRLREIQQHVPGHSAGKWGSWDWNQILSLGTVLLILAVFSPCARLPWISRKTYIHEISVHFDWAELWSPQEGVACSPRTLVRLQGQRSACLGAPVLSWRGLRVRFSGLWLERGSRAPRFLKWESSLRSILML